MYPPPRENTLPLATPSRAFSIANQRSPLTLLSCPVLSSLLLPSRLLSLLLHSSLLLFPPRASSPRFYFLSSLLPSLLSSPLLLLPTCTRHPSNTGTKYRQPSNFIKDPAGAERSRGISAAEVSAQHRYQRSRGTTAAEVSAQQRYQRSRGIIGSLRVSS